MYQEILAAIASLADPEDLPTPVEETPSIVRLPAHNDDRESWQGCTFIYNAEKSYIVRFDDGRVMMATDPAGAVELFLGNADVWM